MDKADRDILVHVQRDATQSVADLAARVGLSTTACWRRLQKLEGAGVIRGRVALVDGAKVGLGLSVFVAIKTNKHNIEWLEDFTRKVVAMPQVIGFFRLAGENDYLLHVVTRDIASYDAFYKQLVGIAELADVTSSFAMEEIKYTTVLPIEADD
jgi:Lrp/AsnC family transcriptional regulator